MNRYVSPNSPCSSASRLRICAWIETSSAETGSSATTSLGVVIERPRDPDPLSLAARELVRVAVVVLGVQADHLEQLPHPRPALRLRVPMPWRRSGSATIAPTVRRGLSDE